MTVMTAARGRDADLVERALDGDRHAFTEVVRRYDDKLRGLAYKLLGGDRHAMDDVMQEAYVRAYTSLPRFRRDADLGTWLYRIVYNACIDELRRQGRRAAPVDASEVTWDRPSTRPGPERVVTAADAVAQALATLPPEMRAAVVLVDGEGFDNVKAAEILGVPPGTIASRLFRGRAAIRLALGEEGQE
jgi:RNA polymerase sigma-70 factor, ECF subfamily